MIKTGFKTHKGMVKEVNEDACFVMPLEKIYMVADGVGGEKGAHCASHTAVSVIAESAKRRPLPKNASAKEIRAYLTNLIEEANTKIIKQGMEDISCEGMCTTIVLAIIVGNRMYISTAGDSRAYILRKGRLKLLTRDHSFVAILLEKGLITEKEAEHHNRRNEITKAIGAESKVNPESFEAELEHGDVILLCSDGLYKEVDVKEIEIILEKEEDMNNAAKRLVTRANNNGGRDNVTAVCIKWEGGTTHE